jgi:hypothetical protein
MHMTAADAEAELQTREAVSPLQYNNDDEGVRQVWISFPACPALQPGIRICCAGHFSAFQGLLCENNCVQNV